MLHVSQINKFGLPIALTGVLLFSSVSNANVDNERPFSAQFSGTVAFTSNSTAVLQGEGVGRHVGSFTNEGSVKIVGPSACPDGFAVINEEKLTAANGDVLNIKITDDSCPIAPGVFQGTGNYVINGGTGRFENATGKGDFTGTGNFNTGKFVISLEGTIIYPNK